MNNDNCVTIFNELYDEYYHKVLAYFKKDFNNCEAEDLTQQTFLKLWSWIPNIQFVKNKKAYIFKIAKNVRCDFYRKSALMLSTVCISEEFEIRDNSDFSCDVDFYLSYLNGLTYYERRLFAMKEQGLSSREIGSILGLSASAVRSRLQAIKKKIKENSCKE